MKCKLISEKYHLISTIYNVITYAMSYCIINTVLNKIIILLLNKPSFLLIFNWDYNHLRIRPFARKNGLVRVSLQRLRSARATAPPGRSAWTFMYAQCALAPPEFSCIEKNRHFARLVENCCSSSSQHRNTPLCAQQRFSAPFFKFQSREIFTNWRFWKKFETKTKKKREKNQQKKKMRLLGSIICSALVGTAAAGAGDTPNQRLKKNFRNG